MKGQPGQNHVGVVAVTHMLKSLQKTVRLKIFCITLNVVVP